MLLGINPSEKKLFKLITWCTLYAFICQTFCCSVWAYSPPTVQPTSQGKENFSFWQTVADFLVSPAHGESEPDTVKYTLTPEDNEDDVTGNSVKTEKDDPGSGIGINTGENGVGSTISGGSGSVNSVMGAYGYSYPIQVPPGRGGLAPKLALNYSSLAQNGWLGHGWNLSIGYIERSTKEGKPSYTDQDTFTINLKGSSITLLKEGNEFRLKDEGLFLRVRKLDNRWEVTDKGGATYSFGSRANTRQMAPEGIFKWCLDSIKDPNGNTIHFSYDTDTANNQIYLKQISYDVNNFVVFESENERVDAITSYASHFKVSTTRRLKRIKVFQGSTSGTPIHRFELTYQPDANNKDTHNKVSKLESIQQFGAGEKSLPPVKFEYTSVKSPFGFKYLVETKSPKHNAEGKNFHMADFNGDGRTDYLEIPNSGTSGIWLLWISEGDHFALMSSGEDINPRHKIVTGDFNGDGKADILTHDPNGKGHAQLYLSTGNSFKNVKDVFPVESKNLYAGDFNGDGKTDILTRYSKEMDAGEGSEPDQHGWKLFFANNKQGFELANSWIDMPEPPFSIGPEKQHIILGDFNGDGKTDVIMKPDVYQHNSTRQVSYGMYLSTGSSLQVVKQGEHGNDQIPYRYDNVYPGDYNGDGKTDLLVTASGYSMSNWEGYKLNLSTDTDFITIDVPLADLQPANGPPNDLRPDFKSKIFPGDYNGDGLTDIIQSYHGEDGSAVYSLSRYLSTGSGFEQHIETQIQSKPSQTRCFSGDFDGDGRQDIFLVDKEQNLSKTVYNKARFMGSNGDRSVKLTTNNLLGKITNILGATTEITYKPSTIWPKDIDGKGTYNPMPIALPTVSTVTSFDNMGETEGTSIHKSTNTFAYEGGRYDIADKEFRGYGKVWMGDSTSQLVSELSYHQQPRFQGRLKKTVTYVSPGSDIPEIPIKDKSSLLTKVISENTWAAHSYKGYSGADEVIYRTFAYVKENKVTTFDIEELEPDTKVLEHERDYAFKLSTVTTLYTFDRFGNITLENKWMENHTNKNKSTRCVQTDYYNNTTDWVLGMPKSIQVGESAPGETQTRVCGPALRETTMTYEPYKPWLLRSTTQNVNKEIDGGKATLLKKITTYYKSDAYGNRTWVSNPRNANWGTTFDYSESKGMFPNLTTNALGHKIHREFDSRFGTVTSETISPGTTSPQTTTTSYDVFGRPETITYPDTSKKSFFYTLSPKKHSVKIVSSSLPPIITYYDNLDREIKKEIVTGSKNILTLTEYTSRGQVWKKSLPFFDGKEPLFTTNTYDEIGRIKTITNPDKTSRRMDYDKFTVHITNEEQFTTSLLKDSLGQLVKVVEPTGGVTIYEYDMFGNIVYIRDPLGNSTEITYDQLDRKIGMKDPYMGNWEYDYDDAGNLEWQKDNEGRVLTMEYDELNRIRFKRGLTGHTGGLNIEYTYDEPLLQGGLLKPSYNIGQLTRVTTKGVSDNKLYSSVGYIYDNMGRVEEEHTYIDGETYKLKHKYDLAGRLDILTYPDPAKTQIDYDYDNIGRLETVWRLRGTNKEKLASYDRYNALGQLGRVQFGNGVSTNYGYNPFHHRVSTLIVSTMKPGSSVSQKSIYQSYTYDNLGNVKTITSHAEQNKFTHKYDYDSLSRLTSAKNLSASDPERKFEQVYTYDLVGNMTQKTGIGGFEITGWEDPTGHIRPTAVLYDKDTTGIGNRDIVYNEDNKPISILYKGNQRTRLYYNGLGKRIKKWTHDKTTTYVAGGLFEKHDDSRVNHFEHMCHVYAAGKRIATLKGVNNNSGRNYFIHGDHLGSTSLVTNSSGLSVEETGYLPFGATLFRKVYNNGTYSSIRKFTDQEFDEEYELYNYNARLYDPVMARFITADTIVPDWTDPQSLNRYSYCRNNPLTYTDPSGHMPFPVALIYYAALGAFIGAAIGGISSYWSGDGTSGVIGGMRSGAISGALFYCAGSFIEAGSGFSSFQAATGLSERAAGAVVHATAGATSGAVNAHFTGGNIGRAALLGAASAGVAKYFEGNLAQNMLVGGITGGSTSMVIGGDFAEGAIQGAWTTAFATWFNKNAHRETEYGKVGRAALIESASKRSGNPGLGLKMPKWLKKIYKAFKNYASEAPKRIEARREYTQMQLDAFSYGGRADFQTLLDVSIWENPYLDFAITAANTASNADLPKALDLMPDKLKKFPKIKIRLK